MPYYVVDRIEGRAAVVIGDDGTKHDVPLPMLPKGTSEGAVLDIGLGADGRPLWPSAKVDPGEMSRRLKRGKERLEDWQRRGPRID